MSGSRVFVTLLLALGLTGCSGDPKIASLAAGRYHTCALAESGEVYCWGWNISGQLGDGPVEHVDCTEDFDCSARPVRVSGIGDAVAIAGAFDHTCAIRSDRSLWCWGYNDKGGLGDGTIQDRYAPVAVSIPEKVIAVAPGFEHTCALDENGGVWCWGSNYSGSLGDGTRESRRLPALVVGLEPAVAIASGGSYTCALLGDDSLWCWGANGNGVFGDGIAEHANCASEDGWLDCSPVPVRSADASGVRDVVANRGYRCLASDVGLSCAGSPPAMVSSLAATEQTAYAAGSYHMCRLGGGDVSCWGSNSYGQIDPGVFGGEYTEPQRVELPGPASFVSAGGGHSCAAIDGSVWCWGDGTYGQLGDGTFYPDDFRRATVPVRVSF